MTGGYLVATLSDGQWLYRYAGSTQPVHTFLDFRDGQYPTRVMRTVRCTRPGGPALWRDIMTREFGCECGWVCKS